MSTIKIIRKAFRAQVASGDLTQNTGASIDLPSNGTTLSFYYLTWARFDDGTVARAERNRGVAVRTAGAAVLNYNGSAVQSGVAGFDSNSVAVSGTSVLFRYRGYAVNATEHGGEVVAIMREP